jgi:phage host-nuclease inhibitor protein Gam
MSSTVALDRPARQASPDKLTGDAVPAPLPSTPLPLDPLADIAPGSEAALAPASSSAPALADLLFTDIDIPTTPPAEGTEAQAAAPFKITDISSASWAAAKVLAAQARIAERAELANRYKARIDAWLSDSNAHDDASATYLSLLLKPYIEAELSRTRSRSRTLHLPTASASLRKSPDHVSVLDEAAAMAFLESNHPAAIVTKKTISLSTLRSLIFTDGEAVPGVEAELGRDSLYLKPRS